MIYDSSSSNIAHLAKQQKKISNVSILQSELQYQILLLRYIKMAIFFYQNINIIFFILSALFVSMIVNNFVHYHKIVIILIYH